MRRTPICAKKINILGDHAEVRSLRKNEQKRLGFSPKPEIVVRRAHRQVNLKYSAAMTIAHLLYPRHFPEHLGSGLSPETTYSKRIYLTKKSQKGIDSLDSRKLSFGDRLLQAYRKHLKDIGNEAKKMSENILKESGINADAYSSNVGRRASGHLVFFEVENINLQVLEKKINSLPGGSPTQELKKKQAMELFNFLKKHSDGYATVDVHRSLHGSLK